MPSYAPIHSLCVGLPSGSLPSTVTLTLLPTTVYTTVWFFAEPGLKLVEWPEKAAALLPRCDLRLTILPHEQSAIRELRMEALSGRGNELMA